MSELIVELGCEDLPSRFVDPALAAIRSAFEEAARDHRVSIGEVRMVGTPRRLTMLVRDVSHAQTDLKEERTGPPMRAAYRDGEPTKAAIGFARGQGVAVEDLYSVDTPKGPYLGASVFEKGADTASLLPELLTEIVNGLSFAKSMRWGARRTTFARPLRWMVALFDGDIVPVSFAGVTSHDHTYGHRFAAPLPIKVTGIEQYEQALLDAHVIVDQTTRRTMIQDALDEVEREHSVRVLKDEALVDEVTQLVEYPHAVVVTFDEAYLDMPDEVLISSMRSHQRYFSVLNQDDDALTNKCVVIYNTPVHDPDVVRAGNLRVLKARLDDATFFWNKDLAHRLEARVEDLERVTWLHQLGDLKQRAHRLSALSGRIAALLGLSDDHQNHAARAGLLAKADLVTMMVGEFTDLQGIMGAAYAARNGEAPQVVAAIADHYLPKGPEDRVARDAVAASVALADKLDALVGIYGVGLIPKSSADPYGLRRAAIGVLRTLSEGNLDVSINALLEATHDVYVEQGKVEAFKLEKDELLGQLGEFMTTRLRNLLRDDYPTDVVDAVLDVASDDVMGATDRVVALASLRDAPDFEPLAIGFKRVVNILSRQADEHVEIPESVNPDAFEAEQERALHDATLRASREVDAALTKRDWHGACQSLITLKAPIDAFFDHVMVMADDEALKLNRLALLDTLRALFLQVANISMIQTER